MQPDGAGMMAALRSEMAAMFLEAAEAAAGREYGALGAIIDDAVRFSPNAGFRARYMTYRSRLLLMLGAPEEALGSAEEAVAADGGMALAWAAKAAAHSALGQRKKAATALGRAAARADAGELPKALSDKGVALGEIGRHGEALECAEESLRLDPSAAATHEVRAMILYNMNRDEESLAALDEGLARAAEGAALRRARYFPLSSMGRLEEALAAASEWARGSPGDANSWYAKARALSRLGRAEEALDALTVAASLDPRGVRPLARREEDLAAVRGTERFARVVGGAARRRAPGRGARTVN